MIIDLTNITIRLRQAFFCFMFCGSVQAMCQDEENFKILGGSLTYQSNTLFHEATLSQYLSATPMMGKKISARSFIGLSIETAWKRDKPRDDHYARTLQFALIGSPIYRFYLGNSSNNLFLQSQLDFGQSKVSQRSFSILDGKYHEDKLELILYGIGIGIGADIEVGNNFFIEPLYRLRFLEASKVGYSSSLSLFSIGVLGKF